ncbi:MAG: hypothetical protein ACRDG3_09850 [Tepidiformaceae bacterium]
MTARQPRRTRRRLAPANSLPRPVAASGTGTAEVDEERAAPRAAAEHPLVRRYEVHHREHHVTKDYSYVHRDLLTVVAFGAVVVAFIIAMSFVL